MSRIIALLAVATLGLAIMAAVPAVADPAATPRTVVVFGARGKIGRMIVGEALDRGHAVIGVSRKPRKLRQKHENFTAVEGDVTDPDSFRAIVAGADVIVISVGGNGENNAPEASVQARAAKTAVDVLGSIENAPYVIQVGGATTMYGDKEAMLANLPMPAKEGSSMYGVFFGHMVARDTYVASDIDWCVISPPLKILGWSPWRISSRKRTGNYRTSTDGLVFNANGDSEIYVADLAVAVVDELENRAFVRQQFTVGY